MTQSLAANPVHQVPFASPERAAAHFAARLSVEADVWDVHEALRLGSPGFVLVDSRSRESWDQGHVPGALHLPTATIPHRAPAEIPAGTPVVVHCWGPGCNGAHRAALGLARLGYPVKEMLGGFEYWVREGYEIDGVDGLRTLPPDPPTAPTSGAACGC